MTSVGASACRNTTDAPASLSAIERLLALLAAISPVLLALVFFPTLSSPFFAPKTLMLVLLACLFSAAAVVTGLSFGFQNPSGQVLARAIAVYSGALLISAVLSDRDSSWRLPVVVFLAGPFLCAGVTRWVQHRPVWLMNSIATAGVTTALLALANAWAGFSVFGLFGMSPSHSGGRMAVIATLGNPNFVAGFLAACAPALLYLGMQASHRAWFWRGGLLLSLIAVTLTRSRVGLVAFLIACVVPLVMAARQGKRKLLVLAAIVAFALAIPLRNPRSWTTALEGRFFIARVATVDDITAFGDGPGTFAYYYPSRLGKWFTAHPDTSQLRFADYQAHAHNDYLQALVETGVAGAASLICLLAAAGWLLWKMRARSPYATFALGGFAAVLATSAFDYSLQRAEMWGLLWLWVSFAFIVDNRSAVEQPARRWPVRIVIATIMVITPLGWAAAPAVASHYVHRAQSLETQSREAEAVSAYRQALRLDRTNPDAHFYLARALANSGGLEAALEQTRAAQHWVDEAELYDLRIKILRAMGRPSDAWRESQEGLRRFPFSQTLAKAQLELLLPQSGSK